MKKQSTMKGFAVLSAASVIVKVLSLLYIPILLGILGEEGNGIYAAAYQVYVLVFVLTNSGIPVAISKLISELIAVGNYKDAVKGFKIARLMIIIVGIVMCLLMFFFAGSISKTLHYEKAYLAILALSPTLLFTAIASAYRGYFQGRGNMTPTAISQVLEQITNTIFTLLFAWLLVRYSLEAGCAGGTIGTSLGALFSAIYLYYVYRKNRHFKGDAHQSDDTKRYTTKELVNKILNYSIPITTCVGLQYAGNLVDVWNTKSRLLAAGFSDVWATKMYSHLFKYKQLNAVPIAFIVSLAVALLPAISAAAALKDSEEVNEKINFAFRLCFLIVIPSAVGMSVLSHGIFRLLGYGNGAYIMQYGAFVMILMAMVQIETTILQSLGKLYMIAGFLVFGIIAKIATNYILIGMPQINIMGAIGGDVAYYLVPIILNTIILKKTLKVEVKIFSHAVKPAIASIVMGITIFVSYFTINKLLLLFLNGYIANAIPTLISIAVGVIVYFYTMILIKGISQEDIDALPQRLKSRIPNMVLNKLK